MARSLAAKPAGRNPTLRGFAVALYRRPGVAAACLELQDRDGVDVPLLLAAVWHGLSGRGKLAGTRLAVWRGLARLWHARTVAPLRAARTAIRAAAAADPAIGRLRRAILAAELSAELLLLRDLEANAARVQAGDARRRRADMRANAAAVARNKNSRSGLTKIFRAAAPSK